MSQISKIYRKRMYKSTRKNLNNGWTWYSPEVWRTAVNKIFSVEIRLYELWFRLLVYRVIDEDWKDVKKIESFLTLRPKARGFRTVVAELRFDRNEYLCCLWSKAEISRARGTPLQIMLTSRRQFRLYHDHSSYSLRTVLSRHGACVLFCPLCF